MVLFLVLLTLCRTSPIHPITHIHTALLCTTLFLSQSCTFVHCRRSRQRPLRDTSACGPGEAGIDPRPPSAQDILVNCGYNVAAHEIRVFLFFLRPIYPRIKEMIGTCEQVEITRGDEVAIEFF